MVHLKNKVHIGVKGEEVDKKAPGNMAAGQMLPVISTE